MCKRIVVGLDGSSFAEAAVDAAIERVKHSNGIVVGVSVIDLAGIEHSGVGAGAGSSYFAEHMIDEKLSDAQKKTRDFLNHFAERCREAGVKYELACEEGVPFDVLIEYGRASDLIIVGQRTFFHYDTNVRPGNTVHRLMEHPVTPVLAVPEKWVTPKCVVIVYDRSIHSTRAMRAFLQQQCISSLSSEVALLFVDEEIVSEEIQHELDLAEKFLHAYDLKVNRMNKQGKIETVLVEIAQEHPECMIVMGSSDRNWLTKLLSESLEKRLMKHGIPVFVFE